MFELRINKSTSFVNHHNRVVRVDKTVHLKKCIAEHEGQCNCSILYDIYTMILKNFRDALSKCSLMNKI